MKAYYVNFKLLKTRLEVRLKFSDITNFIIYFNEKNRKFSVNLVFDHFQVIFLGKDGDF